MALETVGYLLGALAMGAFLYRGKTPSVFVLMGGLFWPVTSLLLAFCGLVFAFDCLDRKRGI
jgi:hypothetical protein